ncbi:hypothetical protein MTO96_007601 [Rhipicephalus appendiculatus]
MCAMQGSAPHEGKGVQGTPQETENPTAENKRADGRRSTRRRRTRPGPETLVQQGRQFNIQAQIGINTEVKVEIGVQDQPGSRNQKEAAEEAHNQEGRRRYGEQESAFFSASPTAPKHTNTQTILVGTNGNAPPNDEVKELRQTIQTLRAENAELRQKLNDLIDELKALRTGQTNAKSQADVTLSATIGRQEFTTTMASMNNALANLSNLISNIQDEARKDRERLVQLTGMKSRGKPYARPSAEYGEQP